MSALELNEQGRRDGGLVIRIARREWQCTGNGAGGDGTRFAPDCVDTILVGEECLEVLWSSPAFASGPRHCPPCARAFYGSFLEAAGS